ncbi:DUF551 domain-containing protein [Kosakonia cowanii]|uniref:DUF551 domain-containing protein n=1 Tax=Kosakonia cowanii TaxID=208223 RepID=UPI002DDD36A2|nr:DUF551 domain-containing protein [Kosakonia cowanii]WRY60928.1 DUF551 domain-containing protein [Kosakonia cowanii]
MTTKLSRERLEALANLQSLECMALPASHAESAEMARMLLAGMDSEPVYQYWSYTTVENIEGDQEEFWFWNDCDKDFFDKIDGKKRMLYTAPPAPVADDYFASLVTQARARADKAMRKFPQPNYVLNKVAEESGEVIKAVIHYTEGREEWRNVEGEIIDNLAMLIRLVQEGDQVIGFTPPTDCRAAMLKAVTVTAATVPDGWKLVPVDATRAMMDAARRVEDEGYDAMHKAMLAAAPATPNGWIKCSERMPDERQEVIVMDADRNEVQSGMIYYDGRFVDFNEEYYEVENPSHWMPLPAAPEQEV